jgi:hypothetical protein
MQPLHPRAFELTWKVVLGSTRQDLALILQNHQHRLPLALVFPLVPEQVLILRLVLADPLQAPFDEPLYVFRIQGQPYSRTSGHRIRGRSLWQLGPRTLCPLPYITGIQPDNGLLGV